MYLGYLKVVVLAAITVETRELIWANLDSIPTDSTKPSNSSI
jgi:hypothetical protein